MKPLFELCASLWILDVVFVKVKPASLVSYRRMKRWYLNVLFVCAVVRL